MRRLVASSSNIGILIIAFGGVNCLRETDGKWLRGSRVCCPVCREITFSMDRIGNSLYHLESLDSGTAIQAQPCIRPKSLNKTLENTVLVKSKHQPVPYRIVTMKSAWKMAQTNFKEPVSIVLWLSSSAADTKRWDRHHSIASLSSIKCKIVTYWLKTPEEWELFHQMTLLNNKAGGWCVNRDPWRMQKWGKPPQAQKPLQSVG